MGKLYFHGLSGDLTVLRFVRVFSTRLGAARGKGRGVVRLPYGFKGLVGDRRERER